MNAQDTHAPKLSICAHAILSYWRQWSGLTVIDPYPIATASATVTPECFFGCFRSDRSYVRIQPTCRPVDWRGIDAKLHLGNFLQCQVFMSRPLVDVRQAIAASVAECCNVDEREVLFGEICDWHAMSIGSSGCGEEVTLFGFEIAQINFLHRMGGVRLPQPQLLISYGLERLLLAQQIDRMGFVYRTPEATLRYRSRVWSMTTAGSLMQLLLEADEAIDSNQLLVAFDRLATINTSLDFAFVDGQICGELRQMYVYELGKRFSELGQRAARGCPESHRLAAHSSTGQRNSMHANALPMVKGALPHSSVGDSLARVRSVYKDYVTKATEPCATPTREMQEHELLRLVEHDLAQPLDSLLTESGNVRTPSGTVRDRLDRMMHLAQSIPQIRQSIDRSLNFRELSFGYLEYGMMSARTEPAIAEQCKIEILLLAGVDETLARQASTFTAMFVDQARSEGINPYWPYYLVDLIGFCSSTLARFGRLKGRGDPFAIRRRLKTVGRLIFYLDIDLQEFIAQFDTLAKLDDLALKLIEDAYSSKNKNPGFLSTNGVR